MEGAYTLSNPQVSRAHNREHFERFRYEVPGRLEEKPVLVANVERESRPVLTSSTQTSALPPRGRAPFRVAPLPRHSRVFRPLLPMTKSDSKSQEDLLGEEI